MRPTRTHTAGAVTAFAALAALLSPVTAHAAAPGDTVALPVREALQA